MYDLLQFDGSLEGFLSLIYFARKNSIDPSRIITTQTPLTLFDEPFFIETNVKWGKSIYEELYSSFPPEAVRDFMYAFLHDTPPLHIELFNYFNINEKSRLKDIAFEPMKSVHKASKYVLRERHKILGFARFKRLKNSLFYAQIEPNSNVLPLLGAHFKKRFSHEWIIHDTKRGYALLHKNGFLNLRYVSEFNSPIIHEEEKQTDELWQKFFTSVTINSRKNYKTQRQFVPLFYRKFMNEFNI